MKIIPRRNEKIQLTLKRLKKMLEKEGITKEMKRLAYYETPGQIRNRLRRKAQRDRLKAAQALQKDGEKDELRAS